MTALRMLYSWNGTGLMVEEEDDDDDDDDDEGGRDAVGGFVACPQHEARATHQFSLYSGCINAHTLSLTHTHTHSSVRERERETQPAVPLMMMMMMDPLSRALLLCLSVLLPGLPGARAFLLPDIGEPDFIRRCVTAHNTQRSRAQPPAANMRSMSWDASLARGARSWARHCKASHNPVLKHESLVHPAFRHVGENIWLGAPYSAFQIESAINSWNREGADYTIGNNSCAKVCGHYTQLMWATSYKVGCAVHVCSRGIENFSENPESTIFVCNYGDAGNVFGVTPYIVGLACSKCGVEKCRDKLCTDPNRDQDKKYDWMPGWDLGPSGSAQPVSDWPKLQLLAGSFWLLYFYTTH